jgi:hypothetical protein
LAGGIGFILPRVGKAGERLMQSPDYEDSWFPTHSAKDSKRRGMDGAPRFCDWEGFERGFVALIDFLNSMNDGILRRRSGQAVKPCPFKT